MSTGPIRPTRAEIVEQVRVVRAAQDDVDVLLDAAPSAPADQSARLYTAAELVHAIRSAGEERDRVEAARRANGPAGLRDRIAQAALHAVEAALGDALTPSARSEALAGIAAVLPAPADRTTVLHEAADEAERLMDERYGPDCSYAIGGQDVARELRRMADEAQQAGESRG
jgi:hypothetical protein